MDINTAVAKFQAGEIAISELAAIMTANETERVLLENIARNGAEDSVTVYSAPFGA